MNRFARLTVICLISLTCVNCGTSSRKLQYKPAELEALLQDRLGDQAASLPIPYEADAEMVRFAEAATVNERSTRGKVDALMKAITAHASLHVKYDAGSTMTAREVFRSGRANCIAYTNLFVSLARAVELNAFYADVTERSRYLRRAGTILHIGHICAAVRDGPQTLLVDFADESRTQYLGYRIIDDVEAVANFVINQGSHFGELLAMPEHGAAPFTFTDEDVDKFRLALRIKPGFAKGLLNLGTAYVRMNRFDLAEAQFRQAIRSDPDFAPAYTALGSIYSAQHRNKDSLALYEMAADRQKNNPYLYFNLALVNFRLQRYDEANRAAQSAVRLDPGFADAYHLLGTIAQIEGEMREARTRFLEALALDPTLHDARIRLSYIDSLNGKAPAVEVEPASTLR